MGFRKSNTVPKFQAREKFLSAGRLANARKPNQEITRIFAGKQEDAGGNYKERHSTKDTDRKMKYSNIREEELKNKVAQDYFWIFDCTKIIGNVDFCVCMHQNQKELSEQESLLWAEAKKGSTDIYKSIVQLILTIGKARTFDRFLPPAMLGAFDGEKVAFIPYNDIHEVFYINDFNWNVTPSNHNTKEFKIIHEQVKP
jgi:hypothetical protein